MRKYLLLCICSILFGCSKSGSLSLENEEGLYTPIPVSLEVPPLFEQLLIDPIIPTNNPLTEEGISLGKKLFFERRLSKDNSKSCASCHNPSQAFSDVNQFSIGVEGQPGTRNAMPLFNLAWNFSDRFAWDGKELGLERQALEPIRNPIELHGNWTEIAEK